jgi:hypothetical protein
LAIVGAGVNRLLQGHDPRHMNGDLRHAAAAHRAAAALLEHRAGGDDGVTIGSQSIADGAVNVGGADEVAMTNDHRGASGEHNFRVI